MKGLKTFVFIASVVLYGTAAYCQSDAFTQTSISTDSLLFDVPDFNYTGGIDSFLVEKLKVGYKLKSKDDKTLTFEGLHKENMLIYTFENSIISTIGVVMDKGIEGVADYLRKLGYEPLSLKGEAKDGLVFHDGNVGFIYENTNTNTKCYYFPVTQLFYQILMFGK